jgi:uncharacterized coiled-coil protein SlyX
MKSLKNVESERFMQVIDNLINEGKLKSYYKLAQELNISPQRFTDIKGGRQSVSRKLIDDICKLYPTVSKSYIAIGTHIVNSQITPYMENTNYKEMENLKKRIEELERVLKERDEKIALLQDMVAQSKEMAAQSKEMLSILKERNQLASKVPEKANRD